MSAVRPEFGPTLPELLGPRVRRLPRPVQVGLAALGALVVLLVLWALLLRGGGVNAKRAVIVRAPVAFNFVYRAPFSKEQPAAGELARVGSREQSFSVRELTLPAYRGDAAGFLPLYAAQQQAAMERQFPEFRWRTDGRANINKQQGYEIVFQYRRSDGALGYGRRVLLLPSVTARRGADIWVLAKRSPAIVRADDVGKNGGLKTSLRSFRFGTERP
ncbi:MAG TPA: hypothetical protein VK501_22770 [Baekduia sp.]|uniref:hypothetical protein n=1 Tax=Baekduia sp. TaxID=2600305 RepID=UPI002C6A64DD|nr:hypothetical protein [Baekduia sp.]HMJ36747.1 hypothetical protein [Baekduia sp.]